MEAMHIPVLVNEVIDFLQCAQHKIYVDGTVGLGGHSERILEMIFPTGRLIGIDRDPEALQFTEKRLTKFKGCFTLFHNNFINIKEILQKESIPQIDGAVLDLGVSSYQIDTAERGFSFSKEAPLDMRMNPLEETTAADLIASLSTQELEDIFFQYGEERWSKQIARRIVLKRDSHPIETTTALGDVIFSSIPSKYRNKTSKEKLVMRVFQALRIAVNQELSALKKVIVQIAECLKPAGRLCIISFHSLEDRIVKEEFKRLAQSCICPPDSPICQCNTKPVLKIITKKPVTPDHQEVQANSRARSAKLRVAEKI